MKIEIEKQLEECENCDYENFVRKGRADLHCPKCDRDITLELVMMRQLKENKSCDIIKNKTKI